MNEKTEYKPEPLNTENVELPKELIELGELLAKNIHENFAKQRFSEGWKYGPKRDDEKKENPTLVPYDDLPEIEKEYDRITTRETLKCIYLLGFKIVKTNQ